jgi:hypothetical protein
VLFLLKTALNSNTPTYFPYIVGLQASAVVLWGVLLLLIWWDWGLNSGVHVCKVDAALPEHFALSILDMETCELFAQAGLEPQSF